ncbi:MAG: CPBP family intramembrane metalloprotease [Clostridiaceae bacterium]|nr:CPBP family intramembrane metalloprotease [Clostridiaceae bacterium]
MSGDSRLNRIFQKPWMGIIVFLFSLVALIFAGGLMQYYWGMMGLLLTEIMILIIALIGIFLSGQKFKDVFPIQFDNWKHLIRQIIGTTIIWAGTLLLVIGTNAILLAIFPQDMLDTSMGLSSFMNSIHPALGFFIVTVMPAICEEALNRGYIQSTLKGIKKDWIVVLIMGLIFGVFHLDFTRFLGTALLGAAMAYILIKTRNFILPVLLHFMNNAFSYTMSRLALSQTEVTSEPIMTAGIATYISGALIICSFAPILLLIGGFLLRKKTKNDEATAAVVQNAKLKKLKYVIVTVVVSASLFGSGIVVGALSILMQPNSVILSESFKFTISEPEFSHEFILEQEAQYMVSATFSESEGMSHFLIVNSNEDVFLDETGGDFSISGMALTLPPGDYRIIVKPDDESLQKMLEGDQIETDIMVTLIQMPG